MDKPSKLRVGTRKSALAMAQTQVVISKLTGLHKDYQFEVVGMTTTGDKILDQTLSKIGEKSLFTRELENALLSGSVDLVVHSLKDLPTSLPDGLCIGAILEREDPADAVIFRKGSKETTLTGLDKGAVVGTSSVRRVAQLRRNFPDLEFKSVRGNLNTRLRKLDDGTEYDALILAAAGLHRLDLSNRISTLLPSSLCLHAVGQGALAVEYRQGDSLVLHLLAALNHRETALRCIAERRFMKEMKGGCNVPLGVESSLSSHGVLRLRGGVFSLDGQSAIVEEHKTAFVPPANRYQSEPAVGVLCSELLASEVDQACDVGCELAQRMFKHGARDLLIKASSDAKNSVF